MEYELLKLKAVRRSDSGDNSLHMPPEFPFTVSLCRFNDERQWLIMQLNQSSSKNWFDIVVEPKDFAALAKLMIQADPEKAVHAFGKALETVKLQANADDSAQDDPARDAA